MRTLQDTVEKGTVNRDEREDLALGELQVSIQN